MHLSPLFGRCRRGVDRNRICRRRLREVLEQVGLQPWRFHHDRRSLPPDRISMPRLGCQRTQTRRALAARQTILPVNMRQERAQSWRRCGWGEPSPGAERDAKTRKHDALSPRRRHTPCALRVHRAPHTARGALCDAALGGQPAQWADHRGISRPSPTSAHFCSHLCTGRWVARRVGRPYIP